MFDKENRQLFRKGLFRRDPPSINLEELTSMMQSWDWNFVFKSIYDLGYCLDDETWRFTKGEVVSMALEKGSNGKWRYADQRGYDLEYDRRARGNSVRVEVKSMRQIFLRQSKNYPHRHTLKNKIQLKNTRGDKQIQNWNQDFDYLLLVQTDPPFIASVVPWEVVDQHSHIPEKGDQVKVERLEEEQMSFITPKNGLEVDFEIEEAKHKNWGLKRARASRIRDYNLRKKMIDEIRDYLNEIERRS